MSILNKLRMYFMSTDGGFIKELKLLLFPVLFLGLLISLPIHPLTPDNITAESFNRVFGNGALNGIDPDKRTNNLLLFNLFWVPICFLISFLVVRLITQITFLQESSDLRRFLNTASIAAIGGLAFIVIAKYSLNSIEDVGLYAPIIAGLIIISILLFTRIGDKVEYSVFKWGIMLSLAMALLLNFSFQTNALDQSFLAKYKIFIFLPIAEICVYICLMKFRLNSDRLRQASIPLFFGMFIIGLWLEFTNILNQHNIFIVDRLGSAKIVLLAVILISVGTYILNKRLSTKWETLCYIGLILGITCFIITPPLQITATSELFEQANSGMLVYDTTHYGKIPLLESFDGHMLKGSLGGLIYSWLNISDPNSIDGSYFYYNYGLFIINVLFFLLLKELFDKEFALFSVLFIPILYIDFYILIIIAFIYVIKRNSLKAWFVYCISLALVALYDIPTAVAVGGGTLLVCLVLTLMGVIIYKTKPIFDVKKFFYVTGMFLSVFILCPMILCFVKDINPILRAGEFFSLINSNNNWAYNTIGDRNSMLFSMLYSCLPIFAILGLIIAIYKYYSLKHKQIDSNNYQMTAVLVVISLLIAYFLNFSRALGRHSLAEGNGDTLLGIGSMFVYLALLFWGVAFMPKFKKQFFVCMAIAFPLIINGMASQVSYKPQSVIQNSMIQYNNASIYYDGSQKKVERVSYENISSTHSSVLKMLGTVLEADETFMDLSSHTMLYALTKKEKPVYINQSPLHLSGEYAQVAFVNEVEKYGSKCAFALIGGWMQLDGVENPLRFYKVYEYLNDKYRPLCYETVEGYSLWIRKDRYDEVYTSLYNNIQTEKKIVKPSYYTDDNWENGLLRIDRTILLFEGYHDLQNAGGFMVSGLDNVIRIKKVDVEGEYQKVQFEDENSAIICANAETLTYHAPIVDFPPIDYSHYNHNYNAGFIPFLWGEYDSKRAYDNHVIHEFASLRELIPVGEQSRENYVLINITAAQADIAHLTLIGSDNIPIAQFNFNVNEGMHRYLIRPSIDSYWQQGDLTVAVSTDAGSDITSAALLLGD